jgi:hypothetical protein
MKRLACTLLTGTAILGLPWGLARTVGAEPTRPAFHAEAGRLMGDVTDQIRSFGAQLDRHLRGLGGGGALVERPLISLMLDHRAELGLTSDQVSRLEALRAEFTREAIRRDAEIRIAEMDLAALLETDSLDLARVEAKVRELAQVQADLRIARLRTIEQGRSLLTPEQRARLAALLGQPGRRAAERPTRL